MFSPKEIRTPQCWLFLSPVEIWTSPEFYSGSLSEASTKLTDGKMKYVLATKRELALKTLLTFIVGLGKLYPSRRKICGGWTWRGPPPQLPPLHRSSAVTHTFRSSASDSQPSLICLSSPPPILASDTYDFLKPYSMFCLLRPNFARSSFLPFSIQTLYFFVVISTSLR